MKESIWDAFLFLHTYEECAMFLSDILSDIELIQIARRVQIANLLYNGETYRGIIDKTNSANVTISRVKNVLERDNSTLLKIIKRMNNDEV